MYSSSPRLSVSTWSLHRTLGVTYRDAPGEIRSGPHETYGAGNLSLLDVPARVAAAGIHTLEICHFHLPTRDDAYLGELRSALKESGVELFSVLVDNGDITHPEHHARDTQWVADWIRTAGKLGAKRARVIAGKSEYSEEALALSQTNLLTLTLVGQDENVRVTTENWFPLLSRPEHVNALLHDQEGAVGLNFDFGNWDGPTKYEDLAAIVIHAESCHAKCAFNAPYTPDADDYRHCLDLTRSVGFNGPYTLIYDGPEDDEWHGLNLEAEIVRPYLQ